MKGNLIVNQGKKSNKLQKNVINIKIYILNKGNKGIDDACMGVN